MTIQHRDTYADDLARQVDKLTNQRDSLLEALRPFAALGSLPCMDENIQYDYHTRFDIAHADIRRAMDAIAQAEGRK